jgi:hypothetical protein
MYLDLIFAYRNLLYVKSDVLKNCINYKNCMTSKVNRQAGDERIVAGYERADIRSIWQVQSRGYRV